MAFTEDFLQNYTSIMETATADDSPYADTIKFVVDQFKGYNITDKEKAELISTYMINITNNITTAAMDASLKLTDKAGKFDDELVLLSNQGDLVGEQVIDRQQKRSLELNILTKQGTLLDKQADKLDADTSYVDEQETQLIAQVGHNKLIKAMESLGITFGSLGAGGLAIHSDMWATYFEMNQLLSSVSAPTNTTVTRLPMT